MEREFYMYSYLLFIEVWYMNSDKRIINVVGNMGGLWTTKSSISWEVLKNEKEEKKDSFKRSEQSSFTNHRQQLLTLQVAFITTITKKKKQSMTLMS